MDIVSRAASEGVTGFLNPLELEKLMELAAGRDVLEIGSYLGLSAWGMAQTANSVTCIDTFRAATNGQTQMDELTTLDAFLLATRRFSNVHHWVGRSEDAQAVIDGKFDLIFIDAMHTYEDVKADLERWWPRVRPGGVLALHDYGHWDYQGVKQAADEVFGPAPEGMPLVTLRWVQKPRRRARKA